MEQCCADQAVQGQRGGRSTRPIGPTNRPLIRRSSGTGSAADARGAIQGVDRCWGAGSIAPPPEGHSIQLRKRRNLQNSKCWFNSNLCLMNSVPTFIEKTYQHPNGTTFKVLHCQASPASKKFIIEYPSDIDISANRLILSQIKAGLTPSYTYRLEITGGAAGYRA